MSTAPMSTGLGLTVPVPGIGLADHAGLVRGLTSRGYSEVWSGEASGFDAFTPLALAAAWDPDLRLGTAGVPAFTRGPAVVRQWNGIDFDQPYRRTRDLLRFLRAALAGQRVTRDYDTFSVHGFRLDMTPAERIPLLLAALRPQMLALA